MFKKNIINVFRSILANKTYSLINIVGLSIAMAVSFLILLYVINELSYDKVHEKRDRIYRVLNYSTDEGRDNLRGINYSLLVPTMKKDIPEIENASIFDIITPNQFYVKTNDEFILETGSIYMAHNDIFNIFTLPVIKGNTTLLFENPNSIVITQRIAEKYFGDEDPVGQSITLLINTENKLFTITGVIKNHNDNTIFKADFITKYNPEDHTWVLGWKYVIFETYILLSENTDKSIVENKLNELGKRYHPEQKKKYELQNLEDIYLHSKSIIVRQKEHGSYTSIFIFSAIAICILIIGCINYIILSTARSTLKSKEIGIRKVIGAGRKTIIKHILLESVFIAYISLPLALVLAERMLPVVSNLFGKALSISYVQNWQYITGFLIITLIVGLISGSYISLHLSKLKPVEIFSNSINKRNKRSTIQKSLIVFQLVIFIILFVCTSTINKQVKYAMNMDSEIKMENLIHIDNSKGVIKNYEILKNELEKNPEITDISVSMSNLLERNRWANEFKSTDGTEKKSIGFQYYVDFDYLETVKTRLIEGRFFSDNVKTEKSKVIINETALKILDYTNPIGKTITSKKYGEDEQEYEIIGLVKDFISGSIRSATEPILIFIREQSHKANHFLVRLKDGYSENVVNFIKEEWNKLSEGKPLEYDFMDDKFNKMYISEVNLGKTINLFTILAIFISSLGLFGLSLFISKQKSKEIGIRKVNGAEMIDIISLIVKEFLWLVLIANIIAIPISILVMNKWLENFAYKTNMGLLVFIAAFLASSIIVLLTLGFNAVKAAANNPAEVLQYE